MRSPCCLCACVNETGYVYDGNRAHLNGILHKSLIPVRVCTCIPLSLLGNGSVKILVSLKGNVLVKDPPIVDRQRLGKKKSPYRC
jgi:hypothetical protein